MSLPPKRLHFLSLVCALSIFGCSGHSSALAPSLNQGAALVGDLPANPLQWKIITNAIDKPDSTMSTLYGNDVAVEYARTHSQRDYPLGSILSLVTWTQREDPRWFGAKIPDRVSAVEFVTVGATPDGHISYAYASYVGAPLKKASDQQSATPHDRTLYLLTQRAAVLP
jgi:hypothetical protein